VNTAISFQFAQRENFLTAYLPVLLKKALLHVGLTCLERNPD
jgi:hypothetical protein